MRKVFPVELVSAAFEEERFHDAHAAVGDAWSHESLRALDVDGKVLAGRLAHRLGSERLGRRLHRIAEKIGSP